MHEQALHAGQDARRLTGHAPCGRVEPLTNTGYSLHSLIVVDQVCRVVSEGACRNSRAMPFRKWVHRLPEDPETTGEMMSCTKSWRPRSCSGCTCESRLGLCAGITRSTPPQAQRPAPKQHCPGQLAQECSFMQCHQHSAVLRRPACSKAHRRTALQVPTAQSGVLQVCPPA